MPRPFPPRKLSMTSLRVLVFALLAAAGSAMASDDVAFDARAEQVYGAP